MSPATTQVCHSFSELEPVEIHHDIFPCDEIRAVSVRLYLFSFGLFHFGTSYCFELSAARRPHVPVQPEDF